MNNTNFTNHDLQIVELIIVFLWKYLEHRCLTKEYSSPRCELMTQGSASQCSESSVIELDYQDIKWANPGLFFFYFWSFKKKTIQFLQKINVNKCSSRIRRRDSNPRPFKHELSPITTRPGLPPNPPKC